MLLEFRATLPFWTRAGVPDFTRRLLPVQPRTHPMP
jgi:hypothetical protein